MSLLRVVDCDTEDAKGILERRLTALDTSARDVVSQIIEDVRQRGDAALLDGARRFDFAGLDSLCLSPEEWQAASGTAPDLQEAIGQASERILRFHRMQKEMLGAAYPEGQWTLPEARIGQKLTVLESVGVYVPGGQAFYPSSVLMNAGPARAAGVGQIIVCTPCSPPSGALHPGILFAAQHLEISQIFKIGGAYAIAAMALGTETVPRVDKIVGPGNRFVNEAKRQLWGRVGLDGYAGSSEVCVLADGGANARFAAVDLLTQVEHAEDNAGFLVCTDQAKLGEVLDQCEALLKGHPREASMRAALANHGMAILGRSLDEAVELVNLIAPEHLSVATTEPDALLPGLKNAGCIMLGEHTPESGGDYAVGPSHTLPTAGAARFGSPVNVLDFVKVQSFSNLTQAQLQGLVPTIEAFGQAEGFPMHAFGASVRLGKEPSWG